MAQKYEYIDFSTDDGTATVRFRVRSFCDTGEIRACGNEVTAAWQETQSKDLIVDFEGMEVVPSSVFAALVQIYKRMSKQGGRLHVCSLGKDALSALYILNLHRLMAVHKTVEEALAAVQAARGAADG